MSIRNELISILRETNATALFVTHDPHEAMAISDRIAYIDGGEIVQFDTPEALYHTPANENVAAFFGSINRYEGGFVRVEQCRLGDSGDYVCTVLSSIFMGSFYITTVAVQYNGSNLVFVVHTDRKYLEDTELFLSF